MARRSDPGFRVIVSMTDRFTKPIDGVNKKIAQSTAKLRGMMAIPGAIARSTGLDKIGGAFANVGSAVGKLGGALRGVLGPFARIGAMVGGFSLGKMIYDSIALGSELIKLSQVTGVSVEALQELQYAAKQSGIAEEELNGSLTKLNKTRRDALKGGKEAQKVFRAIGISQKELATIGTEELFYRVADATAKASTELYKGAIATGTMGRAGEGLLPVLNEGSAGIRKLGQEARDAGAIMDKETAASAKEFGDVMTKLGQHIKGVSLAILKELLPGMEDGATGMDEWVTANKEWIKNEVVAVVRDMVAGFRAFGAILKKDIIPLVKSFKPAWDGLVAVIGKGNAVLLAFTAVVAPGILVAIGGIIKAVWLLTAAIVANPIGAAIIAIVAAVAFFGYMTWKHWDSIKQSWADGWKNIKSLGSAGLNLLKGDTEAAMDDLDDIWNRLPLGITDALTVGFDIAKGLTKSQFQFLTGDWEGALATLEETWDSLPDGIRDTLLRLGTAINSTLGPIKAAAIEVLTGWIDYVKEQWNRLLGWLLEKWESIKGVFSGAASLVGLGGGGGGAPAGEGEGGGEAPAAATGPGWLARQYRRGREAIGFGDAGQQTSAGPAALGGATQQAALSKSEVTVSFANLPEGARVSEGRSSGNTDLNLNTQYAGPRGQLASVV